MGLVGDDVVVFLVGEVVACVETKKDETTKVNYITNSLSNDRCLSTHRVGSLGRVLRGRRRNWLGSWRASSVSFGRRRCCWFTGRRRSDSLCWSLEKRTK